MSSVKQVLTNVNHRQGATSPILKGILIMTKLTQAQNSKLFKSVIAAFSAFAEQDAAAETFVVSACESIAKLVHAHAIAPDIKPKNLGVMFFGDGYKGDKSKPTPELNFIRRVVERLRADGVLVAPVRQKAKAVALPKLEQLKALAHLDASASAEFADAVLFELTEKEIKALVAALQACVA